MLNPAFSLVLAGALAGHDMTDSSWLLGDWVGEFRIGTQIKLMKIHCRKQANGLTASGDFPPFGPADVAVAKLDPGRATVKFEIPLDDSTLAFSGNVRDNTVSGQVQRGADQGSFQMIHLTAIDPAKLAAYRGAYQVGPMHFIWVAPFHEFGDGLFFVDSKSGRLGPLYPESATSFFSGQAIISPLFPIDVRVTFQAKVDSAVSELVFRQGTLHEMHGVKLPVRMEDVRFQNGAVTLAGTLTIPSRKRPCGAVILVHGSGPEDRDFLGLWVEFFTSQGLAVLAYDKRGTGKSSGDWKTANFGDLADDLVAGLRLLQAHNDVDPKRVGLFGISQGGWIAPLAARLSGKVAFMILHAGAAVTPGEQGLQSLESELRASGFPSKEIDELLAYRRLDDAFTRTRKGWKELQESYKKAADRKAEWAEPPAAQDDWFRVFFHGIIDHDSSDDLRQIHCPILAFFGDCDRTVLTEPNKAALEKALAQGGNKDHTVIVLPKANHIFLQAQTGIRSEYPGLKNFVPGYFDMMSAWLKQRGFTEQ
jgi:pimeloyl-ACP methyl ester carboxylesterase